MISLYTPRTTQHPSPSAQLRSISLLVLLLSLLLSSSACSTLSKPPESRLLKATVVTVSANYLQQIAKAELRHLNSLVNWNVYLSKSKEGVTKQSYSSQVRALANSFHHNNHPLLGLSISEIEIDDDFAEITLNKESVEKSDDIWIHLAWNGTAWLVIDDNLFGPGALISKWTGISAVKTP